MDKVDKKDDGTISSNLISAVKVKPPPFMSNNPSTWFAVLEAQFQLARITQDDTRFYHTVAALPVHILTDVVGDIVTGSYTSGDYVRLKSRLISAFTESEASRLAAVLDTEQLGDRTPSNFYRFLQSKAGSLLSPEVVYDR